MKKIYFLSTLILSLFLFNSAATAENDHHSKATYWAIDNAHSNITFQIRHFFTPIPGTFHGFSGDIHFNPEDLENSSVDITIDVASVNTNVERRDDHLRTDDFFDVETYPEMHFSSSNIRQTGENEFVAVGELTIKDVTRQVDLPFEFLGMMEHPQREGTLVSGIRANTSILRNDYGVGKGDFASTAIIGNQVDIEILLELLHEQ